MTEPEHEEHDTGQRLHLYETVDGGLHVGQRQADDHDIAAVYRLPPRSRRSETAARLAGGLLPPVPAAAIAGSPSMDGAAVSPTLGA